MITARVTVNILGRIADSLSSDVDQAVQAGAERVSRKWKATTRVDTGAHRDSIHVERRGSGNAAIVADSDHSVYVELGTRYMRGDHAGVNALNSEKDAIVSQIEDALTS